MPQIIAWECPHTKKVFTVKAKYITHLKKLSAERIAKRKQDAFMKERADFFANMRATVRTIDEFKDFVFANWDKFCENAMLNYPDRFAKKRKPHPKLEYLTITNFKWNNKVSCTHSAPIGKKTNWGGKLDLPTSYPGWHVKFEYQTTDHATCTYEYGGDMWDGTGINTGTGGYANNYYYYCEMFAEDWPGMRDTYEKALVWKQLNNDNRTVEEIVQEMCNA